MRDHQLRKILKQLIQLEKVDKKKISNPLNFKSAAMVTTFIRSAGDRTKGVWQFLDTARQTDAGVKLAELEHSSLKRCLPFCSGRVPILVHLRKKKKKMKNPWKSPNTAKKYKSVLVKVIRKYLNVGL